MDLSTNWVLLSIAGQLIDNEEAEGYQLINYAFSLAAFAQFHLEDIHPFTDGNGIMSRFISKNILDKVCPLPFPMFPVDKDMDYYQSLIKGRKESPLIAPSLLMELMLDSAIDYYLAVLREHGECNYEVFLCGTEIAQIEEQVKAVHHEMHEKTMQVLREVFANMHAGTQQDLSLDGRNLRLMKMVEQVYISLDTL